jgi:thiol-disulfide isomerase/thioredoxin
MAKTGDAAIAEDNTMAKASDAATGEDSTMAKTGDGAMGEDSTTAKTDEGATGESHGAVGDTAMAGDESMAEGAALPAWLMAELVDVNTGQPFAIADQRGKVVLVETLAVWCSNCLRQQQQIQALHEALGEGADLVSVGLDIDLNESPEQLRAHAGRHGFDWTYAVATPEVAREIGQLYGNLFLNPPSTPMLVVDRQGQVHPLPFGIKSAGELQEALAPFLGGS